MIPRENKKSKPAISVVTVNWNRKEDLSDLLRSLYGQSDQDFQIIVVDNDSSDGSRSFIESHYPDIRLIPLDKNYGVKAFNIGVEAAVGTYSVLLDNDVVVPVDFIHQIRLAVEDYSPVNIFALNILDRNGLRQNDYLPQHSGPPVKWHNFIGGGVVFRTAYYLGMGGYHDDFFVYINETEFAARILIDQQEILYCSHITLIHKTSLNARIGTSAFFYYVRNSLLFFSMYFPVVERWNLMLGFLLISSKKAIRNKMMGAYLSGLISFMKVKKTYHKGLKKPDRVKLSQCFQGNPAFSAILQRLVWKR